MGLIGSIHNTQTQNNLTVGVGIVAYPDNSKVTFDQHLGMEWGIANFGDRFTLGLGFNINNTYGGTFGTEVAGEYDYTYTRTSYGRIYHYSTKKWETFNDTKEINRKGVGTAEDDIDSKVVPAISVYVGATYMITDRWGVDAQAGLISANLKGSKKGYPNSYSVFAVGASYRF